MQTRARVWREKPCRPDLLPGRISPSVFARDWSGWIVSWDANCMNRAKRKKARTITSASPALRGRSPFGLDRESQSFEDLDRAGLPALEISGGDAMARGQLVRGAQDRFRWVTPLVPDHLVRCGTSEPMLGEEPLRPQSVILLDRTHHVRAGHVTPRG